MIQVGGFKVETMESIPPGNPFLHDPYHVGCHVGKQVIAMWGSGNYVILVNQETGDRIRVCLPGYKADIAEKIMNG